MEDNGMGGPVHGREGRSNRAGALWAAALTVLIALAGCGGGGDDGAAPAGPAAPTGVATLDAPGGRVVSDVAEVIVPAGALGAPATIRITRNATGAPPLPDWVAAAGEMLEITPHGAGFAQVVQVRLKAPQIALAADERLFIAKADPNGIWELLPAVAAADGMLETQVSSFSFFVPVRVRFTVIEGTPLPFALSPLRFDCGSGPCARPWLASTEPIAVRADGNGGDMPLGCRAPRVRFVHERIHLGGNDREFAFVPASPYVAVHGDLRVDFGTPLAPASVRVRAQLTCLDASLQSTQLRMQLGTAELPVVLPQLGWSMPVVHRFGGDTVAAAGERALLSWVVSGGSTNYEAGTANAPFRYLRGFNAQRTLTVLQQRLPQDSRWTTVLTRDQFTSNPSPTGAPPWMYWGDSWLSPPLGTADNGTQFRVATCTSTGNCNENGPIVTVTVVASIVEPSFTRQPAPVGITSGQAATLSVAAAGSPAPTLQWQTRLANSNGPWFDVVGATEPTLTTRTLVTGDSGLQFRVRAFNVGGVAASDPVTVTVSDAPLAPVITSQPTSLVVVAGRQARFVAGATGTGALSYQWSRNGVPIVGANSAQLVIDTTRPTDAGDYRVTVTNGAGSTTSDAAVLTLAVVGDPTPTAPGIVTQPATVNVTVGSTATFAVGVTGSAPLAFQWRRNGVPIAGATAAALTIPVVLAPDAGDYSVVVTNAAGSATSQAASLAVSPAAPAPTAPSIVQQPGGVVAVPGFGAAIGVTASGSGPLSYRWFRNGVELPSQSGAVLTIASAGAGDDGSYRVEVSNALGTAVSSTVQLTLLGAPAITQQPAASTAASGTTVTFSVAASGDALRYQWLRNGAVVSGATTASHTTASLTLADSGAVYSVVVFNGAGAQVSAPALLTVTTPAATGALLAHEGFDYTLGENLAGKSGGSGWSGAWTATDGYLAPLAASASGTIVAGLGYTDSGGRRLLASGGAWSSSAGVFFGQIQRASVDKPGAAGSTRWLSMIVRQDAPPTGINYVMAAPGRGWSFGSSAVAMAAGIGGTGVFVNCWYCSGTPATAPLAGWTQGSTALLLVRVDFAVSGNDTVSLWVNPTLDPAVDVGAPTATASLSNFAELLDGVTVGWGDFRSFTVDELRIGTGRTAVLPIATP